MGKQETLDGVSIIVNWVIEFLTTVFKISFMYKFIMKNKYNQRTFSIFVKRNNDEMTLFGNNFRKT